MDNYNKGVQDKVVALLEKKEELRNGHGLDMFIKHIPDLDIEGGFNPRAVRALMYRDLGTKMIKLQAQD